MTVRRFAITACIALLLNGCGLNESESITLSCIGTEAVTNDDVTINTKLTKTIEIERHHWDGIPCETGIRRITCDGVVKMPSFFDIYSLSYDRLARKVVEKWYHEERFADQDTSSIEFKGRCRVINKTTDAELKTT